MAEDIKIVWNNDIMEGDLQYNLGDLTREPGLETAIIMSIFTDRRAGANDPIDGTDRRGWWGDYLSQINGDEIGSRVWLLERAKVTVNTLRLLDKYLREALNWLVTDGVVQKFDIEIEDQGELQQKILAFKLVFWYRNGTKESLKFYDLWKGQYGWE